ncbi:O-antigen ligase [Pseudoxanthomonas sp. GW2]|uniref:O-antigen ligase family protein n=1 Tax=Pseudoxanthomonas sp. GW2 TaxID=1211114 RepID=UPI0009FBAD37|nr:O-antigen ligase family protein [Pseudoxanthomonas sp. GW2]
MTVAINTYTTLSNRTRWSIRFAILVMMLYEFQSPRIFGEIRLASAASTCLAAMMLLGRLPLIPKYLRTLLAPPLVFLFIYYAINISSVAWSYAPTNSITHSLTLFIFLLLALTYAGVDPDQFAGEVVKVTFVLAVVSWLMVLLVPNIGALPDIVWRINGPMIHPQRLSLLLSLALICLTLIFLRGQRVLSKRFGIIALVVLSVTLLATQTRAFTFFCIASIGYIFFWKMNYSIRALMLIGAGVIVFLVVSNWDYVLNAISRDGSNTMTLSGRTVAWSNAIEMIRQRPMLGYGFASFNTSLTQHFFASGYIIPHAHNTWVNAMFETGFVGATAMTLFVLTALFTRRFADPSYGESLMFWVILSGLTGLIFGGKVNPSAAIVTVIVAQSSFQARRRKLQWVLKQS